jgi:hypothetical protein
VAIREDQPVGISGAGLARSEGCDEGRLSGQVELGSVDGRGTSKTSGYATNGRNDPAAGRLANRASFTQRVINLHVSD